MKKKTFLKILSEDGEALSSFSYRNRIAKTRREKKRYSSEEVKKNLKIL